MFKFGRGIIHEIDLGLLSVNVQVGQRRLRATWRREFAQDMERFHNIDAEVELTRILSEQMEREIIQEIMRLPEIKSFKFGR